MLKGSLDQVLGRGNGQIHELFDGDAPHHPGGLTASARSAAEILRVYAEDVLDLGPVDTLRSTTNGQSQAGGIGAPAQLNY
jgi:glycogen debranching enzyme